MLSWNFCIATLLSCRNWEFHASLGVTCYFGTFLLFSCFVSDPRIHYPIFLAPMFIIISFNIVIFVIVTRVLLKHRKTNQAKENFTLIRTAASIFSVMTLFGLFWIIGLFSVDKASVFFQWPFLLFNTLQGFILFLFLGVINARDEWKQLLTCNRQANRKQKFQGNYRSKDTPFVGSKSAETKETCFTQPMILSPNGSSFDYTERNDSNQILNQSSTYSDETDIKEDVDVTCELIFSRNGHTIRNVVQLEDLPNAKINSSV